MYSRKQELRHGLLQLTKKFATQNGKSFDGRYWKMLKRIKLSDEEYSHRAEKRNMKAGIENTTSSAARDQTWKTS